MKIKIGRNEYTITERDRFMDNGKCVQLLTQSKETSRYGRRPYPVLSKSLAKKIKKEYHTTKFLHTCGEGVEIFGIVFNTPTY